MFRKGSQPLFFCSSTFYRLLSLCLFFFLPPAGAYFEFYLPANPQSWTPWPWMQPGPSHICSWMCPFGVPLLVLTHPLDIFSWNPWVSSSFWARFCQRLLDRLCMTLGQRPIPGRFLWLDECLGRKGEEEDRSIKIFSFLKPNLVCFLSQEAHSIFKKGSGHLSLVSQCCFGSVSINTII